MTRKESREFMMKVLFQMELNKDFDINHMEKYFENVEFETQEAYCKELFSLICNKKDEVDNILKEYSQKWPLSRMPKTDLSILRLSVLEIKYLNIPKSVVINEAVELAKAYGVEKSSSYVNGILSHIEG